LFDREVVAIYLPSGAYHSLEGVAGDIFLALGSGGAAVPQIASGLAARYDAPLETIRNDLYVFLEQMASQALIVPAGPATSSEIQAPAVNGRLPYKAPCLQTFTDLQQLLLLDPVHDVSAAGWPNLPQSETVAMEAEAFQCRIAGPHVIFERFEEETVAMNFSSGAYYPLYGPAEDVFLLMPENPTLAEIHQALAGKYVVAAADLERALRECLRDFARAGLIVIDPVAGPSETVPRSLTLQRSGSGLPFSTLSLQFLEDSHGAKVDVGEGLPVGPCRYQRREDDLLCASASGEMVAVDLASGMYYRLNEPATDVVRLFAERPTIRETAAALVAKYELPERDMMAAVMTFIRHLLRMKLAAAVPESEVGPRPLPPLTTSARRIPFPGFHVALHQDLKQLIRPLEPATKSGPKPPRDRQAELCAMMGAYFEDVSSALGVSDHYFDIAGSHIRVRRAGDVEPELLKACAHLVSACPNKAADLTVDVFECAIPPKSDHLSLLLEKLHTNWSGVCGARCEVPRYHSESVAVIYHPGPDVLSILDVEAGQAYFLKRDASPLPYWEIGSPFRYILHHWFAFRGIQFVHGAAVGTEQSGVLLAGKGGSGKSTTSLLCAKAGLLYASDDYCLADPKTGVLFSLYNTGKLKGPEDLQRIPDMTGRSRNPDGFEHEGSGKAIFFLQEVWPERVSSGFPLDAILIPRISGGRDSSLERCSAADALTALLPSTIAQLPSSCAADCERLAEISSKLPAYFLHLGTDLEQIPPLVRGVLR
jgi:hypothetical protein